MSFNLLGMDEVVWLGIAGLAIGVPSIVHHYAEVARLETKVVSHKTEN